ncbi:MAG TPA: BrnT family toxin [Rhizomicrobium sp.]|nr:BrnT family toxin [Rhizomicrobium sp.]
MKISYDPAKRAKALAERDLDFEEAATVFAGKTLTVDDDRKDYGEIRHITVGLLRERMMVLVWTLRGDTHHIISFRKANGREKEKYKDRMG